MQEKYEKCVNETIPSFDGTCASKVDVLTSTDLLSSFIGELFASIDL